MKTLRIFASVLFALVLIAVSAGTVWAEPGVEPLCPTTADWGDLPNGFGTTDGVSGAYHLVGALKLGTRIEIDPDGVPTTDARGDDINGTSDDEDGVAPIGLWSAGLASAGKGGAVRVTVTGCTGTCYLSGFLDWNKNSAWNTSTGGERAINNKPVVNGTQTITFDIPAGVVIMNSTFYARFRLVAISKPDMSPKYGQDTGEVEDYRWIFGPTAIDLRQLSAASTTQSGWLFPLAGVLALSGLGWLALRRRQ